MSSVSLCLTIGNVMCFDYMSRLDSVATPPSRSSLPALHFPHLSTLRQHYLVGWAPGSALYFFLCASYQLAVWTRALGAGDRVHCDGCEVWVLCEGGRGVGVLQVTGVNTAIQELVRLQLYGQACQVKGGTTVSCIYNS